MKRLFPLLFSVVLYACGSGNIDQFFAENNELPYTVDSTFMSTLYTTEQFQVLDGEHLSFLYQDVKKYHELNDNYIKTVIKIDSLRKSGVPDEEINKDYYDYESTKIKALHKTTLNEQITAYSWYLYESIDPNQGFSHVFVTLFKENKPYSCFEIGKIASYSDSPAWSEEIEYGEITKDSKVIINQFSSGGEYGEDGDDYYSSSHIKLELSINDGDIEQTKIDTISTYSSEDDKKAEGLSKTPLSDFQDLFSEKELPVEIDSVFISKLSGEELTKLNAGQVLTLSEGLEEIANIYSKGTINAFIEIDSLKQIGKYEEYSQTVDAGMTETSEAIAIHEYTMTDETRIFIWAISDRTSESGPWSEGTIVFASFAKENTILKCYPIAEIAFGGDAPMWGATKIECRITDSGEFQISRQYLEGDDDAGTVDKLNEFYNFIWQNGQLEKLPETN